MLYWFNSSLTSQIASPSPNGRESQARVIWKMEVRVLPGWHRFIGVTMDFTKEHPKLCIRCGWYREHPYDAQCDYRWSGLDLVSGKRTPNSCKNERGCYPPSRPTCGPDGKWWESNVPVPTPYFDKKKVERLERGRHLVECQECHDIQGS